MGDDDTSGPLKFLRLAPTVAATETRRREPPTICRTTSTVRPRASPSVRSALLRRRDGPRTVPSPGLRTSRRSPSTLPARARAPSWTAIPHQQHQGRDRSEGASPSMRGNDFTSRPALSRRVNESGRDAVTPSTRTTLNGRLTHAPHADHRSTCSGTSSSQGFNERVFGDHNNPTCPLRTYVDATGKGSIHAGRNYWHDANNNSWIVRVHVRHGHLCRTTRTAGIVWIGNDPDVDRYVTSSSPPTTHSSVQGTRSSRSSGSGRSMSPGTAA